MEVFIPPILTSIILLFAGFWLKSYLPSYFSEKGKLLAHKEDIEAITKKIEAVKSDFTNSTEILKSGLQRLISLETSHRNEERNSIIEFYTKYNQWLYALLEINYGAYNVFTTKDLIEKRIYLEKFYGETGIAKSKIQLLVKDEEIITLSSELFVAILELKAWFDKRLLLLQLNLDNQAYHNEDLKRLINNYEENKSQIIKITSELKEMKLQLNELTSFFYDNRLNEHKKVIPIDLRFTNKVKAYLTQ